uniref:Tyrosine-protein kinase n=1 Tax=Meloidogyne enterolobii TaxID=390850 RepID=A0A6V7WV16_MELEN|nr:unnamed protein product [Meloidogyne enterolobii]
MAPATCITTAEDELINAPFYHGFQTAAEAEPLLTKDNGRFLVRLIEENGHFIYIVSVYWKGKKHHYRIFQTRHGNFFHLNGIPKRTVAALIRYHRFSQKPVNDESGACLRSYVERSHYAIYREQLTILSVIGHGEFGEVRRGKLRVGMQSIDVAVKTMITDKKGIDPNERIRFLREANIHMRLQHRNIIRLFGVVVYNDPILIVTEYAPGGCLHDRLVEKRPTDKERLNFCRDICFGMAYLESKEVIHRDLTVRNCLLSKWNVVKITDFGLSLQGITKVLLPRARAPIRYVPPETLKTALFSHKSDVWGYGIALFEIWSKPHEEPYKEIQNNRQLRKRILEGYRLTPPKGMPKKMQELMLKTQSASPDNRPTFKTIKKIYFGEEKSTFREYVSRIFRIS